MAIVAVALTSGTWLGAAPNLQRIPVQIAAMTIALLVVMVAGKLGIPRWGFAAIIFVVAIGSVMMGAYFFALFALLSALVLFAGAILGGIAACRGSRLDGDIALAIFVGYAIGQWIPTLF